MAEVVFDSSAVLALLSREPGAERVAEALEAGDAAISAVSVAEIVTKLAAGGSSDQEIDELFGGASLEVHAFGRPEAVATGMLRPLTRSHGLSLGDRACVALAQSLNLPILTADRAWAGLDLGVEIRFIR